MGYLASFGHSGQATYLCVLASCQLDTSNADTSGGGINEDRLRGGKLVSCIFQPGSGLDIHIPGSPVG